MVMIPPLVRDPPPDDRQSSTGRPVSARLVRTQRRYASNFNISFVYEPPRPIPQPGSPAPESPFDKWRAAAELDPPGSGADGAPHPAARADAPLPGLPVAPRRRLHDVLLGTTAVLLVGVLGGIGYLVWSGAVPGGIAAGGTAPKGSNLAAVVQPLVDLAAKAAARTVPDYAASPPPREAAAADVPALRAVAAPALAPASDPLVVAGESAPTPERAAAGSAPLTKASEPGAAASTPATPAAAAQAVPLPVLVPTPAPEQATAAALPPARLPEADATPAAPAVPARPALAAEQAAAQAVPPAESIEPEGTPPVPPIASVTVRLPPAPEWTTVPPAALTSLPEASPLPPASPPPSAVPALPMPSAGPAVASAEAAKAAPGVDTQQAVSTMTLVQQMSLLVRDMHDDGLRFRTEMTALSGAVQAKASSLEERLRLAEARNAAGVGAEAGGPPASDAVAGAAQVLRGYRVQAGSPGAAVLTDVGAGSERAARLLVMVGDQLLGAGRVTGIVQRGRAWIVRTERGVIQ